MSLSNGKSRKSNHWQKSLFEYSIVKWEMICINYFNFFEIRIVRINMKIIHNTGVENADTFVWRKGNGVISWYSQK